MECNIRGVVECDVRGVHKLSGAVQGSRTQKFDFLQLYHFIHLQFWQLFRISKLCRPVVQYESSCTFLLWSLSSYLIMLCFLKYFATVLEEADW